VAKILFTSVQQLSTPSALNLELFHPELQISQLGLPECEDSKLASE